ncbi:MAG TPA: lysozyme inhibitor LprI family protein, partial [Sphingomicrobium sp.]|nr:lysozyme inhibitor LprI family protein [Sphingomicrobium sp.]
MAAMVLCIGIQPNPSVAQAQRPDPWGNHEIGYESGFKRAEIMIAQCLERVASIPDAGPGDCVYAAFVTCEREHGTMSQRDLNDCAHFSRRAWEKRLDVALSQLLGAQTIDPKFGQAEPMVARLRESDRRWREWNEADCELQAGDADGGGTMRRMQLDLCLSNHA